MYCRGDKGFHGESITFGNHGEGEDVGNILIVIPDDVEVSGVAYFNIVLLRMGTDIGEKFGVSGYSYC